jgi:hypothetical protein
VQELDKGKHKPNFIELIDEIVSLSIYYDDDQVADALCNITTVTKAHYVRSHALTFIGKIKGRYGLESLFMSVLDFNGF